MAASSRREVEHRPGSLQRGLARCIGPQSCSRLTSALLDHTLYQPLMNPRPGGMSWRSAIKADQQRLALGFAADRRQAAGTAHTIQVALKPALGVGMEMS